MPIREGSPDDVFFDDPFLPRAQKLRSAASQDSQDNRGPHAVHSRTQSREAERQPVGRNDHAVSSTADEGTIEAYYQTPPRRESTMLDPISILKSAAEEARRASARAHAYRNDANSSTTQGKRIAGIISPTVDTEPVTRKSGQTPGSSTHARTQQIVEILLALRKENQRLVRRVDNLETEMDAMRKELQHEKSERNKLQEQLDRKDHPIGGTKALHHDNAPQHSPPVPRLADEKVQFSPVRRTPVTSGAKGLETFVVPGGEVDIAKATNAIPVGAKPPSSRKGGWATIVQEVPPGGDDVWLY